MLAFTRIFLDFLDIPLAYFLTFNSSSAFYLLADSILLWSLFLYLSWSFKKSSIDLTGYSDAFEPLLLPLAFGLNKSSSLSWSNLRFVAFSSHFFLPKSCNLYLNKKSFTVAFGFSWSGKYSLVFMFELFSFWLCVYSLLFLELLLLNFFLLLFLLEFSGVHSNTFYFLDVFAFFLSVDCWAYFSKDLNCFIYSVYSSDSIRYLISSSLRKSRLF